MFSANAGSSFRAKAMLVSAARASTVTFPGFAATVATRNSAADCSTGKPYSKYGALGQDTAIRTTESGNKWPVYMIDFVDRG